MVKLGKSKQQRNPSQTPWEQYQSRQKQQKSAKRKHSFLKGRWHFQFRMATFKFIIVMIGLSMGLIFLGYLALPISRVASLSLSGNRNLNKAGLISSLQVEKGDSVINVASRRRQIVQSFLTQNPQVKKASFEIDDWNHVDVQVVEYGTAGYLYNNGKYYLIVDNGEIINKFILAPANNFPIFVNFKPNYNLKQLASQYSKLSKTVKNNIVKIKKDPVSYDPDRIRVLMRDKNIVYARGATFGSKMSYYPSIVSKIKKPSIINLEVGAYSYPIKSKK